MKQKIMSDSYISIVPKIKEYPGHKKKAVVVVNWPIGRNIVSGVLSDCILSKNQLGCDVQVVIGRI